MAFPVPEDNGGLAVASGQASIDVDFMATVNLNDILLVDLMDADNDTFTAPGSWQKVPNSELTNANLSVVKMWLRATGSESGSQTFTSGSSSGNTIAGVMSRISGCKTTGNPFEDPQGSGITQNTNPIASEITTTGIDRLLINSALIEDDVTVTAPASGYTLFFNLVSSVGDGCRVASQYQQVATSQTIGEQTSTIAVSEYWGTSTIAMLPTSATDDLIAQNIVTGNVVISSPDIGQKHVLSSQDLETGNVVIDQPSLTEKHILTSQDLATGNVVIENAELGQIHNLQAQDLETGNVTISNPELGQKHSLTAQNLETGNVVISNPVLAEITDKDNLTSQDLVTGNVVISSPVIGQKHNLTSQNIVTGNVVISKPSLAKDPFAFILKIMPRTFADYELTQTQIDNFHNKL